MMFRKLYWVTEGVDAEGSSHILGVYTSIPTLIRNGFVADIDLSRTRLSLTRLDCEDGILASWIGDRYKRLGNDLQQFVDSDDFTADQAEALCHAVTASDRASVR